MITVAVAAFAIGALMLGRRQRMLAEKAALHDRIERRELGLIWDLELRGLSRGCAPRFRPVALQATGKKRNVKVRKRRLHPVPFDLPGSARERHNAHAFQKCFDR
jgi:hypothetical protein